MEPMAQGVSHCSELSALYELETELYFGSSGSHVSDVLGGASFAVKR